MFLEKYCAILFQTLMTTMLHRVQFFPSLSLSLSSVPLNFSILPSFSISTIPRLFSNSQLLLSLFSSFSSIHVIEQTLLSQMNTCHSTNLSPLFFSLTISPSHPCHSNPILIRRSKIFHARNSKESQF